MFSHRRNGAAHWSGLASPVAVLRAFIVLAIAWNTAHADELFDGAVRAAMLRHRDGPVAQVETEYNKIFVNKRGPLLTLSTRFRTETYLESQVDLRDPDDLPVAYAQNMPAGLLYPDTIKRILMVGLGAGSIAVYLGRAMPDLQIDVVELDPGVVAVAKDYFGVRETERFHIVDSDGRVYLNRHKETYDLILLDAYRELGVPFHLLTREFYALVKDRLSPGGAVALNILGNTKLYASTIKTLRAVFPTVDLYPVPEIRDQTQVIAVAAPGPDPNSDTLLQRAVTLQNEHRFRYPLPRLLAKRETNRMPAGGELITDDFAPVGLYEVLPVRPRRRP